MTIMQHFYIILYVQKKTFKWLGIILIELATHVFESNCMTMKHYLLVSLMITDWVVWRDIVVILCMSRKTFLDVRMWRDRNSFLTVQGLAPFNISLNVVRKVNHNNSDCFNVNSDVRYMPFSLNARLLPHELQGDLYLDTASIWSC